MCNHFLKHIANSSIEQVLHSVILWNRLLLSFLTATRFEGANRLVKERTSHYLD